MGQPTNADLMDKLIEMSGKQAVMDLKLDRVETQANKTNGRVTKAEEFINALKAVEHYKKENPTQTINAPHATSITIQRKWFENNKLVNSIGILAAAASAIVAFVVGSGGIGQ